MKILSEFALLLAHNDWIMEYNLLNFSFTLLISRFASRYSIRFFHCEKITRFFVHFEPLATAFLNWWTIIVFPRRFVFIILRVPGNGYKLVRINIKGVWFMSFYFVQSIRSTRTDHVFKRKNPAFRCANLFRFCRSLFPVTEFIFFCYFIYERWWRFQNGNSGMKTVFFAIARDWF